MHYSVWLKRDDMIVAVEEEPPLVAVQEDQQLVAVEGMLDSQEVDSVKGAVEVLDC